MSFVDVFGGTPIQPAQVSYGAITLSVDTTLVWPLEAQAGGNLAPLILEVTPTTSGLSLTLPDADMASVGQSILIRNLNQIATTFAIKDASGNTLLTAAVATTYFLYITDNATAAGSWGLLAFGASLAPVDPGTLAGPGLQVYDGTKLTTTWVLTTQTTNFTLNATSDRSSGHIWTGGAGTATLPSAITAGNGYAVSISNQGGGTLVVSGSHTIDGAASLALSPTEEAMIVSDGAVWWTVSKSRLQSNVSLAQIQAYALGI